MPPRTRSSGTKQPSNVSSRVSDACQPIFGSGGAAEKPSWPRSTMNIVMPWWPASGSVLAATITKSAMPPLVMNILAPSMTQPPSARVARVRIDATSEPVPGSVTAIAATRRPSTTPRR